jgi:polyhydroxyalkanoate synthesis repressor PhaR
MESVIVIRKYPNRRYYNTRDSRHVTLEEIRDLVRDGHDIKVVDSRTDDDITVAVLTQILLEIESPKLAFFPANFLQHLIRMNTGMFKDMTESYFRSSLATFMKAAESTPAGGGSGFGMPIPGVMQDWQRMWLGMMPKPPGESPAPETGKAEPPAESAEQIAALSRQVEEMRRALERLQKQTEK